jgi:hypothetical protein
VSVVTEDSLDWVTFSGGGEEKCRGHLREPCPMEPVARAFFGRSCDCAPAIQAKCVAHRDRLIADAELAHGQFRCIGCEAPMRLLRIEPIR